MDGLWNGWIMEWIDYGIGGLWIDYRMDVLWNGCFTYISTYYFKAF